MNFLPMPPAKTQPGPLFVLALASIALVGPLAVHLFMPVIPAVKTAFAVSDAVAQLTFSIALFAMAFATLAYGSLADRYGRRPVLLSGLALFLAGSVISAAAETALALVFGRLVQAIGAGCGMTLVRAIARDAYGPDRLVKVLAYLTMFYTLGPMVSPAIGGLLVDMFGWRSVFGFALLLGSAIAIAAYVAVYETRPPIATGDRSPGIATSYLALFSSPLFTAFVLTTGFNSATFMTAASASASLMPEYMHRPPTEFGLYFLAFPIGYFIGNLIASRVGNRLPIATMVLAGAVMNAAAVAAECAWLMAGSTMPLALFLPGMFMTMGQGISMPYAQAGSMATIPRLAGTAAGVGVFMQFFLGAAFAQAYGMFADGTPTPMIAVIALGAALSLFTGAMPMWLAARNRSV
jgi:DHA1 family bicyclomycin/chloramphenicol resistance-like MFS transporter